MATAVPVVVDSPTPKPATPSGASKPAPGAGVQISTVEIKTQAKAVVKPNNITSPINGTNGLVAQDATQPPALGKNVVPTTPKNPNIPPGFKLVQKPQGDGTFSVVLRKMTPEELTAAGQTVVTRSTPKPATISSPPATPSTPSRSVTASVPSSHDKPDTPVANAKSESVSPSTSRSVGIAAGATTLMGGLVMAAESLASMAEHGMKIHSTLTGAPLPSTPSATAPTPGPAATSKPAGAAPGAIPQVQSRMVVPANATTTTLATAPTAAAGLTSLPTILQAPLTQVAAPNLAGQPASILSHCTTSVAANTTDPAPHSNAGHAGGFASNDIHHQDAHNSNHAQGTGDISDQQQDDTISHDQHHDESSYQAQDGDDPHNPHDGDIPYEPQDGDIPYEPQDGDIPYEPQDGDIPYEPQDGDIPYEPQDGDIPYEPQEGDIPYDDQDEAPLEHEDAAVPSEHESQDQGEDAYCGGYDDEGYDMDDDPEGDFDHDQLNDDSY